MCSSDLPFGNPGTDQLHVGIQNGCPVGSKCTVLLGDSRIVQPVDLRQDRVSGNHYLVTSFTTGYQVSGGVPSANQNLVFVEQIESGTWNAIVNQTSTSDQILGFSTAVMDTDLDIFYTYDLFTSSGYPTSYYSLLHSFAGGFGAGAYAPDRKSVV